MNSTGERGFIEETVEPRTARSTYVCWLLIASHLVEFIGAVKFIQRSLFQHVERRKETVTLWLLLSTTTSRRSKLSLEGHEFIGFLKNQCYFVINIFNR